MSLRQGLGKTNEWYTPQYVFDALGETFDLDVAHPPTGIKTCVPTNEFLSSNGLAEDWFGFVWMNPPFGGRNGVDPWLQKFFEYGNGIALTADRTSAPWWQKHAIKADALLFTKGKVRFLKPDGSLGGSPANGVTLWAAGRRAVSALKTAQSRGLGLVFNQQDS